jgi:undecaprenyl diphosphate synthase
MAIPEQMLSETCSPAVGKIPRHVAIIMDGNGRWAASRLLPRVEGHRRGVEAVRRTVRACRELGVGYLTLYSFSSENWTRPPEEVGDLMGLIRRFIRKDLADLHATNVLVKIIGMREGLDPDIRAMLQEAEALTANNTGLVLVFAFNYGARQEILAAVRQAASAIAAGKLDPNALNPETFARFLDTAEIPDPDLIIRTSGEQRLSNFLLWQAAYAEFVFTPVLWPDFDRSTLESAIMEFNGRERRFGGRLTAGSP